MKKFYFLKLEQGANKVLNFVEAKTKSEAAIIFSSIYKELSLDEDGYCRMPEIPGTFSHVSYCVAEGIF